MDQNTVAMSFISVRGVDRTKMTWSYVQWSVMLIGWTCGFPYNNPVQNFILFKFSHGLHREITFVPAAAGQWVVNWCSEINNTMK
jgi:hypothetical protein